MTSTCTETLHTPNSILRTETTRARHVIPCFCRVSGCQNLLFGKMTDFCSDLHRNIYHSTARDIGHGVIAVAGYDEAQEFKRACERMRSADKVRIEMRKPKPEQIDLGAMTQRQKLLMLCRAAKMLGVLPGKWAGRED